MQRPTACAWCGARTVPVHVHGHAQCGNCGTNIQPCCDGADPASEAVDPDVLPVHADPELFARLFERLGGSAATVTSEALTFALVEQLAIDLPTARLVLDAGQRTGHLESPAAGCYRLTR